MLQARCSGYYLDVERGGTDDGTNIWLYEKNGSNAQRWYFVPWGGGDSAVQEVPDGEYQIVPILDNNKALHVEGNGVTHATHLQLWSCIGDSRDTFNVRWLGNGYYEIENKNSNLVLDVNGALNKLCTNVLLCEKSDYDNKKWLIKSCGGGYFNIISKCNGLYLDLTNFNTNDGTDITMYFGNGTYAQKWKFVPYVRTVEVESLALNKNSLTLTEGTQATLKATIQPENATDKTLTWISDNPSVADVNGNGVVTANSVGITTISAISANGKSAVCKVTVKKAEINPDPSTAPGINPNESTKPSASTKPDESTKPGESTKPSESIKPDENVKPGASTKPGESVKPSESTKPSESVKPSESINPSISAKPSVLPSISIKPSESVKPSASTKPSMLPNTSTQPSDSMKPSVQPSASPGSNPNTPGTLGDVNSDGKLNLSDAQICLKAALHLTILSSEQLKYADVNKNGSIDLQDAQMILKAALHIIVLTNDTGTKRLTIQNFSILRLGKNIYKI